MGNDVARPCLSRVSNANNILFVCSNEPERARTRSVCSTSRRGDSISEKLLSAPRRDDYAVSRPRNNFPIGLMESSVRCEEYNCSVVPVERRLPSDFCHAKKKEKKKIEKIDRIDRKRIKDIKE